MYKTTIGIKGMMCGQCESHINNVIRKNFDVKKVKASKSKKNAVIVSDDLIDESKMKTVIYETGYEMTSYHYETYEKKGLFSF